VDRLDRRAALQAARHEELTALLDGLLVLRGDERVLDVGTGLGALAFALAGRVREVVAIDSDPEVVERLRATAPANVEVLGGDGARLPFGSFEFDVAVSARTLHHIARPELVIAELVRVTKPGGSILVADQLAPVDPLAALELNSFERARDATTTRVLAEGDLRALFDANSLVLRREEIVRESRDIDAYLDAAGCEGDDRERVRRLAPASYEATIGWFLLTRP
jgi:ubiquinone/menaquinone biosynthesis C-methylase UbiE